MTYLVNVSWSFGRSLVEYLYYRDHGRQRIVFFTVGARDAVAKGEVSGDAIDGKGKDLFHLL